MMWNMKGGSSPHLKVHGHMSKPQSIIVEWSLTCHDCRLHTCF